MAPQRPGGPKPRPGPGAATLQPLGVKQLSTVTPRCRSNRAEPSASPSLPPRGLLGRRSDQVEQMELEAQGPTRQGRVAQRGARSAKPRSAHVRQEVTQSWETSEFLGSCPLGKVLYRMGNSQPQKGIWTHQTNQRTPVRTKLSPRNLTAPQSRAQEDLQKHSAPRQKFPNVCSQRSRKT